MWGWTARIISRRCLTRSSFTWSSITSIVFRCIIKISRDTNPVNMSGHLSYWERRFSHSPRKAWDYALISRYDLVSGTVGASTLSESQLASHEHRMYYVDISGQLTGQNINDAAAAWEKHNGFDGVVTSSCGSSNAHTHPLSTVTSNNVSNLPPFCAYAYIMRVAWCKKVNNTEVNY